MLNVARSWLLPLFSPFQHLQARTSLEQLTFVCAITNAMEQHGVMYDFSRGGHKQPLSLSRSYSSQGTEKIEDLPFFGPEDPNRWPIHKTMFLGGILFFPLWFIGAFLPVRETDDNWSELFRTRCQAIVMILLIVGAALIVLETAFRGS